MVDTAPVVPVHKWTHIGDRVRILKCVDRDRKSHGGFLWPERGPVEPLTYSRDADCESGGLFGWPWGLAFGDGKEPLYDGQWIVFEAHPEDVIDLSGKVKAVPNPEMCRIPEVIFCGSLPKAIQLILDGQIAWIKQASRGAASVTGRSGAASATGESGAASATGERGAASATGWSGAASATGWSGAASATDWSGAASATGERGAASATGERGAASATGESGAASATGRSGAASATGEKGIACLTGPDGSVQGPATGLAVSTAEECWWYVVEGCLFLQRWDDGYRLVSAQDIGAKTGDRVRFVRGDVLEYIRATPGPS